MLIMIRSQSTLCHCLVAIGITLVVARAPSASAETTWKAGSASVNITPDQFMWMAGYASRTAPANGKVTDLWAKALALEDVSGNRAVLVSVDLIGIDRGAAKSICESLQKQYGLARQQIALCMSHTHSGPIVGRNLASLHYLLVSADQQALCDEYTTALEQKVVQIVGQALDRLALAGVVSFERLYPDRS